MPDPDRPVTLIASRTILRNAVFTVFADHLRDASGAEVTDYLRVVPRQRAAGGVTGIAVLPLLDGAFGLIRVYRHPIGESCWEAARGFVDAGETPAEAARRELLEETGLVADPDDLRDLGTIAPEPGLLDARVRLFVAERCRRASAAAGGEVGLGETRFFAREDFLELIGRGAIVDPSTQICAYRYFGVAGRRDA
jgi:8-oxo-dGTP pyrophosphatase MutT (NUDIX family)